MVAMFWSDGNQHDKGLSWPGQTRLWTWWWIPWSELRCCSGTGLWPGFQYWVSKDTHLGWIGCPILFHPIALYTKNMDIRVSKISNRVSKINNRVSKRHRNNPLANGLLWNVIRNVIIYLFIYFSFFFLYRVALSV